MSYQFGINLTFDRLCLILVPASIRSKVSDAGLCLWNAFTVSS